MIRNTKENTWHPSSFLSSFTGYIDQIFETVESEHKSLKIAKTLDAKTINRIRMQTRKSSDSIPLFREQLTKWRHELIANLNND